MQGTLGSLLGCGMHHHSLTYTADLCHITTGSQAANLIVRVALGQVCACGFLVLKLRASISTWRTSLLRWMVLVGTDTDGGSE